MPELLTVFFSSLQGLFATSIFNIISSNVINFFQYIWSIRINKNEKVIKRNRALKIELIIVISTIIIPIAMVISDMEINIGIVPIFILAFIMLYYLKTNAYKVYKMNSLSEIEERKIKEEKKWAKNKNKAILTWVQLIGTGIVLYIIGNLLGSTLDILSSRFNIPQAIIGIILGFITSLPELITFVEAQRNHERRNDEQGVIEATSNLFTSNMLNLFIIESIGIVIYTIVI